MMPLPQLHNVVHEPFDLMAYRAGVQAYAPGRKLGDAISASWAAYKQEMRRRVWQWTPHPDACEVYARCFSGGWYAALEQAKREEQGHVQHTHKRSLPAE